MTDHNTFQTILLSLPPFPIHFAILSEPFESWASQFIWKDLNVLCVVFAVVDDF